MNTRSVLFLTDSCKNINLHSTAFMLEVLISVCVTGSVAEYRCDCGEVFVAGALLARHASLAHTPPRRRRDPSSHAAPPSRADTEKRHTNDQSKTKDGGVKSSRTRTIKVPNKITRNTRK